MRHPLRATGLALSLIGLACSGLDDISNDDPYEYEPVAEEPATQEEEVSAFNIQVGDCFQNVNGTTVTDLTVVPCSQPHDNEAYHTFDVRMPSFDEAKIEQKSEKICVVEFQKYVGKDYDSSQYYAAWMTPTAGSWANGDREVICILNQEGTPMTGSAKGTGL